MVKLRADEHSIRATRIATGSVRLVAGRGHIHLRPDLLRLVAEQLITATGRTDAPQPSQAPQHVHTRPVQAPQSVIVYSTSTRDFY